MVSVRRRGSCEHGTPTTVAVLLAALAALVGTGCEREANPSSSPFPTTAIEGTGAPEEFDPPSRFNVSDGATLPAEALLGRVTLGGDVLPPLPVTLYETTAYVAAPDGLTIVDALSGQLIGPVVRPQEGAAEPYVTGENPTEPPLVTNVDGTDLVVVPFVVDLPGEGTTPGRRGVELVAVAAGTADVVWRTLVELEPWADSEFASVAAVPVSVNERTVVIRVFASNDEVTTYGFDVVDLQVTWTSDGFAGYTVTGGTVVGTMGLDRYGLGVPIAGVSVDEGTTAWTTPYKVSRAKISEGGPTLAVVTGDDGDGFIRIIDVASGTDRLASAGNYTGIECQFDGMSVIACRSDSFGPEWAAAFDSTSAALLWSLPDEAANRTAPEVTSAWHGAVYGQTDDGPVVLDARTGADREVQPGAAPYVVNGYVGIGVSESGRDALAFPTDG